LLLLPYKSHLLGKKRDLLQELLHRRKSSGKRGCSSVHLGVDKVEAL